MVDRAPDPHGLLEKSDMNFTYTSFLIMYILI